MTTTTDILIKSVKTKNSTCKFSTVGSQRLGLDLEEGRRPYIPEDGFFEGRRSIKHKRRSDLLI